MTHRGGEAARPSDTAGAGVRDASGEVTCNICGWTGAALADNPWLPRTACPRCFSQLRHRLLVAALTTFPGLGIDALVRGKRVLHFAAERGVADVFRNAAERYVTADLSGRNVDLPLDMCDMRDIADGSFDLVVACDVLEHVPDDSTALREVWRILSGRGWAILTVPQKDGLPSTYEDRAMTTPEQRKQAFGQEDHLRIYGDDFHDVVGSHGFDVTVVSAESFDAGVAAKHVLFPPVLSTHPLATNRRKIYFAKKRDG